MHMTRLPRAQRSLLAGFLIAVVAVSVTGCPTNSPIVIFKDTNLEAAIRTELGLPFGFLTRADLLGLEVLDARSRGIRDLTGLEFAENLVSLDLDTNEISDLIPLANLIQLETLNLDDNEIFDLTPLAGLLQLSTLSLFNNQVADLSPLITNAQNNGLGEGDVIILDSGTLDDVALQQAEQLVTEFHCNVVLTVPSG
jgi:Leucine-rich repeat (LRR) protein